MDTADYYAMGIGLYAVALTAEHRLGRRRGMRLYHPFDTLTDLGCLLGTLAAGLLVGLLTCRAYGFVYARFAILRFSEGSPLPYALAFLGVDFLYYWWHRCQHRINLLWMFHAVHHQSKEYNLAVGLRVPWLSDLTAFFFFWPMPLLGVPPMAFFFAVGALSLYNLFLHTKLIDGRGPHGRILMTASFHRVHHSRAFRESDNNFGTLLSVWDRMFGTFRAEESEVSYGTARPFRSWNAALAQVSEFGKIWALASAARRPIDRLKIWFMHPGWIPAGANPRAEAHGPGPSAGTARYVVAQFALAYAAVIVALALENRLHPVSLAVFSVFILATLATLGGLSDGRRWAVSMEAVRMGLLCIGIPIWIG